MLQNAYFLAKIGADTAENEQHFAEILPKTGKILENVANLCRDPQNARSQGIAARSAASAAAAVKRPPGGSSAAASSAAVLGN